MAEQHRIHVYEKAFLAVSVAMLLVFAGALVYATTMRGMTLPGEGGRIDPKQIYHTAPFEHPGVYKTGPNRYTVVMIAMAPSAENDSRLQQIIEAYKTRFKQQSVGLIVRPACVSF